jgi:hypothetical protein
MIGLKSLENILSAMSTRAEVKKIKYFLHKRKRRLKRVSFIEELPSGIERLDSQLSRKDLPVGQLLRAKQQFLAGFFEDSILNSAFAVEYALLIKLDQELEIEKKRLIAKRKSGLGLVEAIGLAEDRWINKTLAENLRILNNLRNMSAHPGNWLSLYSQLKCYYENPDKAKKWVCKVTKLAPQQIEKKFSNKLNTVEGKETVKALTTITDNKLGDLPDLSWASRKDTLDFQFNEIKNFSEALANDLVNKGKVIGLTKRPESAPKYLLATYKFSEELAFKSLKIAHEALCQLGYVDISKNTNTIA